MDKIEMYGHDVAAWLDIHVVPECKFTGKVWCLIGTRPGPMKTNCFIERAEIKIKDDTMTIEYRSFCEQYHGM
jgi:hypothetical protein